MNVYTTSAETCVDRHHRLLQGLRSGQIIDAERCLFLTLLDALPGVLASTPYLAAVSWDNGRFDLLFTDGHSQFCAVEVKAAPEIWGKRKARRNRREKRRQNRHLLVHQTRCAFDALLRLHPDDDVYAVGLWFIDGRWDVVASHDRQLRLAA
jgi:hypothetical protein